MSDPRFITTRLEIDMASGEVVRQEGFWYDGPVAECKGADADQNALMQTQKQFATQLAGNYTTQFGAQSAITQGLTNSLNPIINAGPNQYGFSNAEDAAMRTQASDNTAAAYQQAKQATGEAQAAAGGGNTFLPSGVKAQENAALAQGAAQANAGQQLDITKQGYETGRQNFNNAVGAEQGVAQIINPNATAGLETSANTSAMNEANEIANLNNAASPWGTIGGILGGAAGAFLGPMGASIGSKIGSSIGGAASKADGAGAGSLPVSNPFGSSFDSESD